MQQLEQLKAWAIRWGRQKRNWPIVLGGIVAIALLVVVALTHTVTQPALVQRALTYQAAHPTAQVLVGYDDLVHHSRIKDVQIRSERGQSVMTSADTKVRAYHVSGTYTWAGQSRHEKLPFALTLAQANDIWYLATPQGDRYELVPLQKVPTPTQAPSPEASSPAESA